MTLPAIRPALIAGAVLAWARALGEFGATITFAGNFPGTTQTMPLAIYLARESDPSKAIVLSLVLVGVSFAVLVGLRDRWLGCDRPRPATRHGRRSTSASPAAGALELDRRAPVEPGELVAVLGPNGAGKSTLLRCLAGLLPIDDGFVRVDGVTLDDPADDGSCPPERRPIGVVFQDYLLFPNLSALENVAFGLRAAGTSPSARPGRRR